MLIRAVLTLGFLFFVILHDAAAEGAFSRQQANESDLMGFLRAKEEKFPACWRQDLIRREPRHPIPCGDCAVPLRHFSGGGLEQDMTSSIDTESGRVAWEGPGLPRQWATLLRSLADAGDSESRVWAVRELGRLEPAPFNWPIPMLVKILRNGKDDRAVRIAAAVSLETIGTSQSRWALGVALGQLRRADPELHGEVREALVSVGKPLRDDPSDTEEPDYLKGQPAMSLLEEFITTPD